MQGFGVHTFRLVNARGEATLVKFHWTPKLGVHSLVWDEAVKISGADPDYNRRDLWEAIEAGEFPEWELGIQVFSEEDAERFSFDVLDATKLIPEELVPVQPIGRLVLNRNPDNFFAETEQVAFCTAHVVPGIDFTNDPLLAGRIHSYVDTQLLRLGGPNFHEIPINAPLAPVHNNQRDGFHRQTINRGRVSYEPNSLAGGCPFQQGMAGFVSFPEPVEDVELRVHPERFAEHFNQATLFWNSQSPVEKRHIIQAYAFELSKVTVPSIRERVLSLLRNVDEDLATAVAAGIGMPLPEPAPRALAEPPEPELTVSGRLSIAAFPGEGGARTRKVAIFVANGVEADTVRELQAALFQAGAVARLVGPRIGPFADGAGGEGLDADASFENEPGPLFDAVAVPPGVLEALKTDGRAGEFLQNQFRHNKPMLVLGDGVALLEGAGILRDPEDFALIAGDEWQPSLAERFIVAIARHRNYAREKDPPLV
jgi:catalase